MHHLALIDWLNPQQIIDAAGPWALLVVCAIIFAETGLLIGFLFPGDTLLIIAGLLTHTSDVFGVNVWIVALLVTVAAIAGGEVGYQIGHSTGPKLFERKESGIFSVANVRRTNAFFERFGGLAIILARFVPIVRTFAPVAAGIGHMPRGRYSLYNALGGILWAFGLIMLGYVIAYIPWIRDLVTQYIDVILLVAVGGTALFAVVHYIRERIKVKRALAHGGDSETDSDEAQALILDAAVFDHHRSHDDDDAATSPGSHASAP